MPQCVRIKADSTRCGGAAIDGSGLCYSHHPDKQDQRRQAAARGGKAGGRGRPNREIRRVKDRLLQLADDVLAGSVDRSDAAVASQVLNVYLRSLEVERRAFDLDDLVSRLDDLEAKAQRLRGA